MTLHQFLEQTDLNDEDLRANRLGLMSESQQAMVQAHVEALEERYRRDVTVAGGLIVLGIAMMIGGMMRLPLLFIIGSGVLIYGIFRYGIWHGLMNRLRIDLEGESVRIVNGRVSRRNIPPHPLFRLIRVESRLYKIWDDRLNRAMREGGFYAYYYLPQSEVIIAVEPKQEGGMSRYA